MFYVRMAWRSLRRTHGVTIVMVVALSLGIGTWYAQQRIFDFMRSKMPYTPSHLYHVALERGEVVNTGKRPQIIVPLLGSLLLTPVDAHCVLDGAPTRHVSTFGAAALLELENRPAEQVRVRYAEPSLFALFDVPIIAGRVYADVDEGMLEEPVARRLFGSPAQSLGRSVLVDGEPLRVVGVVGVQHRDRYHLFERFMPEHVAVFVSLDRGSSAEPDFRYEVAGGESGFYNAWVELPTPGDRVAFIARATTCFDRARTAPRSLPPFAVTLRSSDDVAAMFAPGGTINLWPLLAGLCLATCVINLVRMLMVKFGGRSHDLGLLRAFGARQRGVMGQLLLEALLIGLVAGVLGVLVGVAMMPLADHSVEATPAGHSGSTTYLSVRTALTTIGYAIAASLLAAIYPAWRLSRGTPAAQLGRT